MTSPWGTPARDSPGQASGHGAVHQGLYGWLFLTGGSNDVLAQYQAESSFDAFLRETWIQLLVRRKEQAVSRGMTYHHVLVPEKLSIYPEFVAPSLPLDLSSAPCISLPAAMAAHPMSAMLEHVYVDVRGVLRAARYRELVYWRTDTHWTPEGAFVAYQELCSRLGIAARLELRQRPAVEGDAMLDLGGQVQPRVLERAHFRDHLSHAVRVAANPVVEFKERNGLEDHPGLHVGSHVRFENRDSRAADMRVLLFGDSFAESRPYLLTGLLAETVRRVDFVWSSQIDWNLVDQWRPDVILTELAERFHVMPPSDDGFSLPAAVDRTLDLHDPGRQRKESH